MLDAELWTLDSGRWSLDTEPSFSFCLIKLLKIYLSGNPQRPYGHAYSVDSMGSDVVIHRFLRYKDTKIIVRNTSCGN